MPDIVKLNCDGGSLKKVRSLGRQNVRHACHKQIAPSEVLFNLGASRTPAKRAITFFSAPLDICISILINVWCLVLTGIRYIKRLPQVSHHEHGKWHMQLCISFIPCKPFSSMDGGAGYKQKQQGYGYSLHNLILPLNLRLSRGNV